ncbi:MAG: 3-deoxy-7-phosphoheptulonate synthase [Bacteroidota bacterium]
MILHISKECNNELLEEIALRYQAVILKEDDHFILITSSKIKGIDDRYDDVVEQSFIFEDDIQLASKKYIPSKREIKIGNLTIGGKTNNTLIITGPCSVESEEQIEKSAGLLKGLGLVCLRAGSFKPRTSPYTFQGMGIDGLKLLAKIRDKYGFYIFTEVRDSSHIDMVIEYADVIQIGAKSMYDHRILRKCGKTNKPILLKRGFGTTLQEFVQSSEFILSGGNKNVILCERGIRTFETKSRFTLDLCGVAFLKEHTNLPIILDPSHAMGYAYGVPDLARACFAMDTDGLLIESHPDPSSAKSDASQQLNHQQFTDLFNSLKPLANALNRNII